MDDDLRSSVSSRLTTPASRSPSPPPNFYPSPPRSSQASSVGSPLSDVAEMDLDECGPPPAKRRKVADRRPRTTEYLDLSFSNVAGQQVQLDKLLKVIRKKRKIVVIAGAGISVSAGIPDFRSSTGLFRLLRSQYNIRASGKHLFDASVYRDDLSTALFHHMVQSLSRLTETASPTPFHHLLARLAYEGRLMRLYTQNVDGIDTRLPPLETIVPLNRKGPWPKTVQLHGGLAKMVCSKCQVLLDFDARLFEGPIPPTCKKCEEMDSIRTNVAGKRSHGVGKLRPRMVLYNEHNPDDEAIGAVTAADLRARPDAVIVVGTALKVPGVRRIVREMCGVVRSRRDGITVWINSDPEPSAAEFKDCWDLVVRGKSDDVARHAALRKWNDDDIGEFQEVTDDQLKKIKVETGNVKVIVESPRKPSATQQGVLTPNASPKTMSKSAGRMPQIVKNEVTVSRPNPASQRRPITKGLRKNVGRNAKGSTKGARSSKRISTKNTSPECNSKITAVFKVTKASSTAVAKGLCKSESNLSVVREACDKTEAQSPPASLSGSGNPKSTATLTQQPRQGKCILSRCTSKPRVNQPMAPISPQAARHNSSTVQVPYSSMAKLTKYKDDGLLSESRTPSVERCCSPKKSPPISPIAKKFRV